MRYFEPYRRQERILAELETKVDFDFISIIKQNRETEVPLPVWLSPLRNLGPEKRRRLPAIIVTSKRDGRPENVCLDESDMERIARLPFLVDLELRDVSFEKPELLGRLLEKRQFSRLILNRVLLNNKEAACLPEMPQLTWLEFQAPAGMEHDEVLRILKKCPNLEHLTIQFAKPLDVEVLPVIAEMQKLKILELFWFEPKEASEWAVLAKMPCLLEIQLFGSRFGDRELDWIKGFLQLERLDLSDTKITDKGCALIGTLTTLTDLQMARTAVTDEGIRKLSGLNRLRTVNLEETTVTGTTMDFLEALPLLKYLWAEGTGIHPDRAEEFERKRR